MLYCTVVCERNKETEKKRRREEEKDRSRHEAFFAARAETGLATALRPKAASSSLHV